MTKNEEQDKKNQILQITKSLVEISKMKVITTKGEDYKKLIRGIFCFPNVTNLQNDIFKTDKKFAQLYSSFLEVILNSFTIFSLSGSLLRAIVQNFTLFAQSTGTLPNSDKYCDLVCRLLLCFPDFAHTSEIVDFFNTVIPISNFTSSFFYSESIKHFVGSFFLRANDIHSISFLIQLVKQKAVFSNSFESNSYFLVHDFVQEIKIRKSLPGPEVLTAIRFISVYIERVFRIYPQHLHHFFESRDFDVIYSYLVNHLIDDIFNQFMMTILSIPNDDSIDKVQIVANTNVFHFIIKELFKVPNNYQIHLKLLQSLLSFITEYHVDVNSFQPKNFFVSLFNISTHNIPEIRLILLDFMETLVKNNYEYSFIIFGNYLDEYKEKSPFERLSHILENLLTIQKNNQFYLQNILSFFKETFGESRQKLGEFLDEYPSFQMLIVLLFQNKCSFIPEDENPQITWMRTIMECSEYFNHSNVLIQLLTVDPSSDLICKYIAILKDTFSPSLFKVLTTTLQQCYILLGEFLHSGGLQTIDELLPSLNDDLLTNLLFSISSHPFSDELNQSIFNLPNNHRFFNLKSPKSYYKIIGSNPMRLPIFLPFVKTQPATFSHFDLMNIAKYALPMYLRFNKSFSFTYNILNRYVTYNQACAILAIEDNLLAELIDLQADHFPFYEILPNSQNMNVNLPIELNDKSKKSLVFWFNIISPFYKPLIFLQFGNSQTVQIEHDLLFINNFSVKIERNKWHSIVLNNKFIKIDGCSYTFKESQNIRNVIIGQSNVDLLWRISPNIRIVDNNLINQFLENGYKDLETNDKFQFVQMPNEILLVEYAGLPFYFNNPGFFSDFLNTIEKCTNKERFAALFLLYCKSMIINNNLDKNQPFLLHILSTKTNLISAYLLSYIFDFCFSEKFVLNIDFWLNLSDQYLSTSLNHLLSKENLNVETVFNFFITLLTHINEDSKIQIILFFLSRFSSQFPKSEYMKCLIELVLFTDQFNFSLNVRIFFLQTALQNDISLSSKSMPDNYLNKLFSYSSIYNDDEMDNFNFAIFNLLDHFSENDIEISFPIDTFDATPFVLNFKHWHNFYSLLTGKQARDTKRLVYNYYQNPMSYLKNPSLLFPIVQLTLFGLAVLVQTVDSYQSIKDVEIDIHNSNNPLSFLLTAVEDSFKILNQIYLDSPSLFHNDVICNYIQVICPLIPNLESIFTVNQLVSQFEGLKNSPFDVILNETLQTWNLSKLYPNFNEMVNFSLNSPKRDLYSKSIIKLINRYKAIHFTKNHTISFSHLFVYTNFLTFSINLLLANSDKFNELVYFLFCMIPFIENANFGQYFKLIFQFFISNLNYNDINAVLFENILKFIIQSKENSSIKKIIEISVEILLSFIHKSLEVVNLTPHQTKTENSETVEDPINDELIDLVREVILFLMGIGAQKAPTTIIQTFMDNTTIIQNKYIFDSPQMICFLYLNLYKLNEPQVIQLLSSIWPVNDQLFKKNFINNFSMELYDAFQNAINESNIKILNSYRQTILNFLDAENNSMPSYLNNNSYICEMSKFFVPCDLDTNSHVSFDIYASFFYEFEMKMVFAMMNWDYLSKSVDFALNTYTTLYNKMIDALKEQIGIELFQIDLMCKKKNYKVMQCSFSRERISPFSWPFWPSRTLMHSFESTFPIQSKQNDRHPLFDYEVFDQLYLLRNYQFGFNAVFIRNDVQIKSSVFVLDSVLLILFNSSINESDKHLMLDVHSNKSLNDMVLNFDFGKFSSFRGNPIVEIDLKSILAISINHDSEEKNGGKVWSNLTSKLGLSPSAKSDSQTLELFSLKSASFILKMNKKEIPKIKGIIKPFIKDNFNSFSKSSGSKFTNDAYFKKLDLRNLYSCYEKHSISNFEFLLLLNAFNGKSFNDFNRIPIFTFSKSPIGKKCELKKEIPHFQDAYQYYSPDFFEMDTKNGPTQFVFENKSKLDQTKFSMEFVMKYFGNNAKTKIKSQNKQSTNDDHLEYDNEYQMTQLSSSRSLNEIDMNNKVHNFISLNPQFYEFRNCGKFSYQEQKESLLLGYHISISTFSNFFVLDCSFQKITEAFRIIYKNNSIVKTHHISSFSYFDANENNYLKRRSIINEHDLIVVTFWSKFAVMWNIVNGLPITTIDFNKFEIDGDLVDAIFEEHYGLIAFCTSRTFMLFTINGTFICKTSSIDEVGQKKTYIEKIVSFNGFKIEYKTAQNEQTRTLFF